MMISGDICPDQSEASVGDHWPMRGRDTGWDILTLKGNLTRAELTSPSLHTGIRTAETWDKEKWLLWSRNLFPRTHTFCSVKEEWNSPRDDSHYNSILEAVEWKLIKIVWWINESNQLRGPNPKRFIITCATLKSWPLKKTIYFDKVAISCQIIFRLTNLIFLMTRFKPE